MPVTDALVQLLADLRTSAGLQASFVANPSGAIQDYALTGHGVYGDLPENDPLLAIRTVIGSGPTIDDSLTGPAHALVEVHLRLPAQNLARPPHRVRVVPRQVVHGVGGHGRRPAGDPRHPLLHPHRGPVDRVRQA